MKAKKKIILLTGAAGFIGSNLLRVLFNNYKAYHFLVLDNLTYAGNQENIPVDIKQSGRFEFWYGSVTNITLVETLMKRADWVVHLAAETHVSRSIFDNSNFFTSDVIGTQVLMNALVKNKTVEKFIHISTSEVYGSGLQSNMSEEHPLNPCSPYAAAKVGADRLVYSYCKTYDVPAVIVRPFNNYGPYQHLEKMIPRFITSALKNEPVTIHGDGSAKRDWIHVDDHCAFLDKVLHSDFEKIKHQVINVGTGLATSNLFIAETILTITKRPYSLLKFIGDRPGQVAYHQAATERASSLIGWQAAMSLKKGLEQTIEWYKRNRQWWEKLEWMKQVPVQTGLQKVELH